MKYEKSCGIIPIYIENNETEEEHKYWDYDVYFFDAQTKTLFFIHNNI